MNRHPSFASSRRRFFVAVVALFFLSFAVRADNPNSIIYSKHNLSINSPGTVHATAESDVCIFCHAPHGASATDEPLWDHQMSVATYKTFSSDTLNALNITIGQPNGSSRLCLSCHDGTVALGSVSGRLGGIAMNTATLSASPDNLGTDLSSDHPISFTYSADLANGAGNLWPPDQIQSPEVTLDQSSQLQCTSCHDPHNDQYGNFLVMDNTDSMLCLACHKIATWTTSAHALSGKLLPVALAAQVSTTKSDVQKAATPAASVAHTACASCHISHGAGNKRQLMRFPTPEDNCLSCHGADGPGKNVAADMKKFSTHPISMDPDAHSPREDLVNPPVRHATCADCHNPHAASTTPGSPNQVSGALAAVSGIGAGGNILPSITHEYELCFRCHGDSVARGPSRVPRQFVQTNTRLQFNPGNVSFHPVEAFGKNSDVPSLIQPFTASSLIGCTDCHNNDQGSAVGGTGANGPHGSAFVPLLERMLLLTDGTPYNPANFALCYKCHSSSVVLGNTSFRFHNSHVVTDQAACTTCHDSHAATQPHLINFNTAYVAPNSRGQLSYTSTGAFHGVCSLTCHGKDHVNTAY